MGYLIDTCVFIDHLTGRLSPAASAWLERVAASGEGVTSVLVCHELLFGARTPQGPGRREKAVGGVGSATRGPPRRRARRRDQARPGRWGKDGRGYPNSLIAATAEVHGLRMVTANVKDFPTVPVVHPGKVGVT